ncbi:ABC transporter permease [Actinomadura sp. GTD37]|uniref:ABC transporter permease n=1 Tax=Actinomadura sp. GTD37 TaxID=1778030 RepID=UPI0035BFFB83
MAGDRTLVLAACATALFATTVLAALVGYTGSVIREGLRRTLADATFTSVGATVGTHVPAGGLTEVQGRVGRGLGQIYRDVPLATSMSVRSDSFTLPGQEKSDHPELTAFETYTGIERHARLAAGRWPGAGAAKSGEVEAVLPAAAARAVHADVGDVLALHGRVDKKSVVRVRVVGLFDVPDPQHYFWQDDRLITTGVERLDYTTRGPFVVRPEVFAERFTGTAIDARFTVMPDLRGVAAGDLGPLGDRVAGAGRTLEGAGGDQVTVVTELPVLTEQLRGAILVARSTMLIPVIQLVLLAGCAWLLVARLLADHRRGEVALLRTRGMGMRQLARLGLVEGLLIVLPAAVLGPLLAGPLLRLAGHAPAVRDAGLRLDTGPLAPLWTVSVLTALVCACALTIPTLRGANRTFVETQAGIGRQRRGGLRGSGIDLALLLVAGLAIWQLTRYGADGAGAAGEGTSGIDPFIVSGPALALLAGGVLLLRVVPVVSRVAERAATRRRGLVAVLGTRQVGRRQLRYAGPVLLLVMAMAVGILSVTTMATWRKSQTDQADFQSGADLRVSASTSGGPASLGQGGRFAALPGVTAATGVLRAEADLGNEPVTLLGVDTDALGPLLRVQPGLRDDLRLDELAKARPAAPALTVPGRPKRLLFDLRLTSTGPAPGTGGYAPPAGTKFKITVSVADAHGLARQVALPGVPADGDDHTVALGTADLAGPGGVPSYPLSVRGFHYAYDENTFSGPLDLKVAGVRGDGTGDARPPAGARWDVFGDSSHVEKPLKPSAEDASDPHPELSIPATPAENFRQGDDTGPIFSGSGNGAAVHAVLGTGAKPSHGRENTDLQPVVPGVITRETAERGKVGVGGTVTLSTVDGEQPVKVTGIAPALPSVPAGEPGVLVDLPTLTQSRLAASGTHDESTEPGEWWASVRGGATGPAVRELTRHPDWGEVAADRVQVRAELRDAPLGAALQGALVLGFGAALAFAVIAFVVNAAVTAGERAREFAVLRALGVHPRQVAGVLAIEQAYLVALGLLGGTFLGLIVARLVVPHIVLSVQSAQPYPPAELVVQWPVVLAMLAGVAAVLGVVLPPVIRMLRRRNLGAGLRAGEDR